MISDTLIPQRLTQKSICGWHLNPTSGKRGLGDALVLGPNLRKSQLSLDRKLVEQWLKGAPRKSPLLAHRLVRRPVKLLLVLEEWVAPAWTQISIDPGEVDAPFAVGLNAIPSPQWMFLALPESRTFTMPMSTSSAVCCPSVVTNSRGRQIGL